MRGQKQYCRSKDAGMLDDSVFMRLNVCEVLKAKAFSDVLNFQMAGEVQAGVAGGVEPFFSCRFQRAYLRSLEIAEENGFLNRRQSEVFEKIEKLRAGSSIGDVVADKIFDVKTHDFTT